MRKYQPGRQGTQRIDPPVKRYRQDRAHLDPNDPPRTGLMDDTDESKLAGVEVGADVTDATNVDAAGAVMESDYDANTILAATVDDTPAKLTVGEQTMVGRKTGGNIAALTATEVRTMINVEDGADVTDATNVAAAGAVMKTERKIATSANITAGNYSEFEEDGTLKFVGDATVWDDLRVSLLTSKLPSSNYPDFVKIADDGSSSTGIYGYSFDDGEYVFVTTQLPHSWKEGTTIYPHIHFMTTSDVDPTDNFGIGIEYTWTDIDEDMAANSTLTPTVDVATGVDSNGLHQIANVPAAGIAGTDHTISSVLIIRLFRAAASGDNYADPVIITDFDIHYEKDTAGSRGVTTK